MHELILLASFGAVGFRSEPSETFFVNIYAQWLVRCNDNVNSQIELMTVN